MLGRRNRADCEMEGGDLGLGRGLKPGALPKDETNLEFTPTDRIRDGTYTNNVTNTTETAIHVAKCLQDVSLDTQRRQSDNVNANGSVTEYVSNSAYEPEGEANPDSKHSIAIGTSLQQHKLLFNKDLQTVRRNINNSRDDYTKSYSGEKCTVSRRENNLEKQLQKAKKKIECLQKDLSQCHDQLASKVKVIQMLRSQSLASEMEDENVICKLKRMNESLQQEVNRLTFDLEHKDSSVATSQQTWTERFDSLAIENAALHDVMRDKMEDMRQMYLANIALQREKDELLALLEVNEKQRYEALSCPATVGDFNNFSSLELAVLGACKCVLPTTDPCSCAQTAANLKRDIRQLKDSVVLHKKHHQEALVTVDAYRSAFEEQLSRNKTLVKKMADYAIATTPVTTKRSIEERMDKAKAVLKFLIQTMIGDIPPQRPSNFTVETQVWSCTGGNMEGLETATPEDQLTGKTYKELTEILVEMMSDRSEALAHHRLAARLLAQHTRKLEEKLAQVTQQQSSTTDHTGHPRQDLQPSTAAGLPRCSSDEESDVESANGL